MGATSMRPAGVPFGLKLGDILFDEFFQYVLTVTFAGTENQQKVIPIQADAHFITVSSYMNSSLAAGAGTFQWSGVNRGGSLVQLTDGGTQRALSNAQVPANCLFGSAMNPYVWPLTKLFRANTSIIFNVTGLAGAQVVDYVLGGFKIPLDHAAKLGI